MLSGKFRLQRKDRGLKKFKQRINRFARKDAAVTVGVHGDADGDYDGISVLEIATIHEFGLGQPQRSFLRAWVAENKEEIDAITKRFAEAVVAGRMTEDQALKQMGVLFTASIQKKISAGVPPPNEQSTIDRKGSSTPLIENGILRASIDHKIDK